LSLLLNVAVAASTLIAMALLVIGLLGWRRSRRPKTLILATGFGWFALAGLLSTWWIFTQDDLETLLTIYIGLSAVGLLTIYYASVKR
jgi:apolipoprotein N-acyltransferase